MTIRVNLDGREVKNSRPSGVAITPFNVLMSEGSGSVKGLFGCSGRTAPIDAVGMENVSNEQCSVALFFNSPREGVGLAATGSYLSCVVRIAQDWAIRLMRNRQDHFSSRLSRTVSTSQCPEFLAKSNAYWSLQLIFGFDVGPFSFEIVPMNLQKSYGQQVERILNVECLNVRMFFWAETV